MGILLLAGRRSLFNGGRSQINMNNAQTGYGQFDWANVCLYSGAWIWASGPNVNEPFLPDALDVNGYPTNPMAGGVISVCNLPTPLARPGLYVIRCTFTGSGSVVVTRPNAGSAVASFTGYITGGVLTVASLSSGSVLRGQELAGVGVNSYSMIGPQLSGTPGGVGTYQIVNYSTGLNSAQTLASSGAPISMTTNDGSTTVTSSNPGRIVFSNPSNGNISFGFAAYSGAGQITQFSCTHADDEVEWMANPFLIGKQSKRALTTGKFGVVRDLNYSLAIGSMVTTWATRKPTTHYTFGSGERRPSLYAGATTQSGGSVITLASISYAQASFVGSVATTPAGGAVLTVTSMNSGSIAVGSCLGGSGTNVTNTITAQLSGAPGGIGTYQVFVNTRVTLTIASSTLTAGIVTAVTISPHGQTGSFPVSIEGCRGPTQSIPNYNGQYVGTFVDATTFTYPLRTNPGNTATVLGKASFGVFAYNLSFNDPTYGNGAPVDKQTIQLVFDAMANVQVNMGVHFSGAATCEWDGHPFSGGEMIGIAGFGGSGTATTNSPNTLCGAEPYYVLPTGLVPGVSFQFSTSPGGSPKTFTPGGTLFTASIASGVLTVTSGSGLTLNTGVMGSGVTEGTRIVSQLTGTPGGTGTYQLNTSQTLSSRSMGQAVLSGSKLHTLNLNGTGAKPIYAAEQMSPCLPPPANFVSQSQGSVPSPTTQYGQVCLGTAIYDEKVGGWLLSGGCQNGSASLQNAVPPEAFISLCIQVGAHPHFCIPHMALDPVTDYSIRLDQYVQSIAPWMIPRYEPSNEIWNTLRRNTAYAYTKSYLHWNAQFSNGGVDYNSWYGKAASTLGQTIAATRGLTSSGVGTGYHVYIAVQTVGYSAPGDGGQASRFTSSRYVGQSQGVQPPLTANGVTVTFAKDPAYTWCTHGCGANYFNPSNFTGATGIAQADTYVANACHFTGSISGNVLTVTSIAVGSIQTGQLLRDYYGYIPPSGGTVIGSQLTGTAGGVGTYNVNQSPSTTASMSLWAYNATAWQTVADFVDTLDGPSANYNLVRVKAYFQNLYDYCQTLTNGAGAKLGGSCYEGGYGPDFPGGNRNYLFSAAKYHPDLGVCIIGGTLTNGATVNGNYNDLASIGIISPSAFNLGGSGNPWSIADPDVFASPDMASLAAIAAYNA